MKAVVLLAFFLVSALSFQMTEVAAVDWPFKSCGDGDFAVSKFTWSETPAKGKTVTLSVVTTALFRSERLKTTLVSTRQTLLYPSMGFPSM